MQEPSISRRDFIGAAAATVTTAVMAPEAMAGSEKKTEKLPTVAFGEHRVSRLIVGGNPVSGNSHFSRQMSDDMLNYFSAANVKKMLRQCEEQGINTWQSRGDKHIMRLLREYRNDGGTIQWIVQTASEFASFGKNVRDIASMKPIGIYHHGSRTDRFWFNKEIDKIRDDLKIIRESGVRVGLGSHIPRVLEYIEEKDWDVDFFMACFYNINNRVDGQEVFLDKDRAAMVEFIKQSRKQCIAFKIMAASRNANSPQDVRNAFNFAYKNIKPGDIVNIGMFPKYSDQVSENSSIAREILAV